MLKHSVKKLIYIFTIFFIFCNSIYSQMPDWTMIIDKDGNRFFLDKNGSIWTSGEPDFVYKPVSIDGLDYYLNQGIELIKNHYKTNGLILLKSILALPADNGFVYNAQQAAAKEIHRLSRNEGDRFEKLNKDASLLLFRNKNLVTLINDDMNYSFTCPDNYFLKIISKRVRIRKNYKYYGILLGLRFEKNNLEVPEINNYNPKTKKHYSGFDILIAIDAEKFANNIKKAEIIEAHWRKRLGYDTLKRELLKSTKANILYQYKDSQSPGYSGIEGFLKKNNTGYFIKAITGNKIFEENKAAILRLTDNFKVN